MEMITLYFGAEMEQEKRVCTWFSLFQFGQKTSLIRRSSTTSRVVRLAERQINGSRGTLMELYKLYEARNFRI
jgi:hypothetical protein